MIWPYAISLTTKVIKLKSKWYLAIHQFIRKSVSSYTARGGGFPKYAVPFLILAGDPKPAAICLIDMLPKPLFSSRRVFSSRREKPASDGRFDLHRVFLSLGVKGRTVPAVPPYYFNP